MENENQLILLSFNTGQIGKNQKLYNFRKKMVKWEKTHNEVTLHEKFLLQNFLMFVGEFDRQWKTLGRKNMLNSQFILLVLLKNFRWKVQNFFVRTEKTKNEFMEIVNFIFEKLGWEKVNLYFLKVRPPKKKGRNFFAQPFSLLWFQKISREIHPSKPKQKIFFGKPFSLACLEKIWKKDKV